MLILFNKTLRASIDLGVPIVSIPQLISLTHEKTASGDPDFQHPFYQKISEMVNANDYEALVREKIPIKLLRLTAEAQDGLIITDFPDGLDEAELLEEFRGGLNAFVHISLPDEILVDIEESKICCQDCGKTYYKNDVISEEHGVRIDKFLPEDGHCYGCGSTNLAPGSDPVSFERDLEVY